MQIFPEAHLCSFTAIGFIVSYRSIGDLALESVERVCD
ncbi:hypothetical protein HMPREF9003_1723 [Bifidobacterium dentium JCVIHMP022]|uniref:Uncharacterized protein n=1 Tax=Bifidobacterium dentium JCVIHMP022 TaxID=553191 RepID=A0AB72Z4N6_9BIFI|nr:hypothetical protein HMPREF9003_1723 [Bifidobacterium dentium JCVIHMP022]